MSRSLTHQMFESLEEKYGMKEEKPSNASKSLNESAKNKQTIKKVNMIIKEAMEDTKSYKSSELANELFAIEDEFGITDDWSDMDNEQRKEAAQTAVNTLLSNHSEEEIDLKSFYDELKSSGYRFEAEALNINESSSGLDEEMLTESEIDIEQYLGPENYISENLKEEFEDEVDSDYEFLDDEFDTERELN